MATSGIQGFNSVNWFAGKGSLNSVLGQDALNLLKSEMGFKGVKVVSVEKGIKGVEINSVLKQLDLQQASKVNQEVAHILGLDPAALNSVLVVVGGLELVNARMKELKKSLKKVDNKEISKLAQQLGIINESDVVILADDGSNSEIGGLIFVQAGLREIEESIQEN